ncbi:MAG TPA: hypothetical protein VNM91_11830 [Dehalococcoidia bacterium]|nr:hypothetical protein [Dehalococcoidia bacterium]
MTKFTGQQTYEAERRTTQITNDANIKAESGKVCRAIVVAGGAAGFSIWDDPAANNNLVFVSPNPVTTGQIFELQCPMDNGIRITFTAGGTIQVTLTWS